MHSVSRKEFKDLSLRVKRIEDVVELSDTVTSFDWKGFTERDKHILFCLYEQGGVLSTTEIATEMLIDNPESSGRAIVYRRLKRIERISKQVKGVSLVVYDKKAWSLNYEVFAFKIKKDERVGE